MRWLLVGFLLPFAACKTTPPASAGGRASTQGAAASSDAASAVEQLVANFERVHFSLDSATLSTDAKDALRANASILQEHPTLRIEVQGHADERGTIDYNLALGQRRAITVVDYLTTSGVSGDRLAVVSYGEERPLESGLGETAWAANRRAEFRILEGQNIARGTVD